LKILRTLCSLSIIIAISSCSGVKDASSAVSVSISPQSVTVAPSQVQQFTASVSGSANTAVTWRVDDVPDGDDRTGTISRDGRYSAPQEEGSHNVIAVSVADPTKQATAKVVVSTTAIAVSVAPANVSLTPGQTQQFTASVTGSDNHSVTWGVDGVAGGNATTGIITKDGFYTAPAAPGNHTVAAKSAADSTKIGKATVTVAASAVAAGVLTERYDNARTGLNPNETILTPANVNSASFGKIHSYGVDSSMYAQPLYVQNLNIPGKGVHNVIFVATEHDTVYAFDADGLVDGPLWKRSFIDPANGITPVPTGDVGSTIFPEIGITSTPVIDPATGTLYVVPLTKENGDYVQRLHALDITTGSEKFGGPVTLEGEIGNLTFDPKIELQRASLLLLNGVVYIAFASHGDHGPYHGWIMGYDAATLKQVVNWTVSPTGNDGSIWQSGCGLSADAAGNIYAVTSNGQFDVDTHGSNYGDSILKLTRNGNNSTPNGTGLAVTDFFTPFNEQHLAENDIDLGSAGLLLIPGTSLGTTAGKEGSIYVVDTNNMGHFRAGDNGQIVQFLPNALGHGPDDNNFSTAAYFNGFVYYIGENDNVKQFQLVGGKLTNSPVAVSPNTFDHQGGYPVVSANGTSNGILWAVERIPGQNGILHAYDATNVARELYNTDQAGSRDHFGNAVKFAVPTVINGKVYVEGLSQLAIYGLLH